LIKVSNISIFLSVVVISLLAFQLGQIAFLDSREMSLSRINQLIFAILFFFGFMLIILNSKIVMINYNALFIFLFFLTQISFVFFIKNNIDLLAFSFSRHSALLWFLVGLFSSVALFNLYNHFSESKKKYQSSYLSVLFLLIFCIFVMNLYGFSILGDIFLGISYQPAGAAGAKLIFLSQLIFIIFLGANSKYKYFTYFLITLFAFPLVAGLFISGSALILAFFITNSLALLAAIVDLRPFKSATKLSFFLFFLILIFLYSLEILGELFFGTRLEGIQYGIFEIESVNSRISRFNDFFVQFAVDPFIGNYDSHEIAGSGEGWYMHSVFLSLLSHSGILGFLIFSVGFIYTLIWQFNFSRNGNFVAYYLFWSLIAVFLLGSVVAFFTWTPLWFILGMSLVTLKRNKMSPNKDSIMAHKELN
jgi:hypothetical protein